MEKLQRSKFIECLGQKWLFLNVALAVAFCNSILHAHNLNDFTNNNDNNEGEGCNGINAEK